MPYGDTKSNSSSASKVFDQTYYSRHKIKNKDNLVVGFTFNKGLLKVEISEEKESYRYDPLISINLSPAKAKLLLNDLKQFVKDMKDGKDIDPAGGVGVMTGMGDAMSIIVFKTTGNKPSIPEHSFIIGKVNGSKEIESAVEFVFNSENEYSLHWTNVEKMEAKKQINQFAGIELFIDILDEFVHSASGAMGAAVWDTGRYDMNRLSKKFDPIYEKLGVEVASSSGSSSGSSNGYYKKSGSSSGGSRFGNAMNAPSGGKSTKKSFDEIEDMFD